MARCTVDLNTPSIGGATSSFLFSQSAMWRNERLTRPSGKLISKAVEWRSELFFHPMLSGCSLNYQRPGYRWCVDPLFFCIENLERLDTRFLPKNCETLKKMVRGYGRKTGCRRLTSQLNMRNKNIVNCRRYMTEGTFVLTQYEPRYR